MIKILIVEDDTNKLRLITEALCSVNGVTIEQIDEARDALGAKRKLQDTKYDLLILDIAIPDRIDQEVRLDGGLRLLEEIETRDRFIRPGHVVGITALEQARAAASQGFATRLWTILPFAASHDDWVQPLQARVQHIIDAQQSGRTVEDYRSDLAVLCALPVPELSTLLRMNWSWRQVHVPTDDSIYFHGEIPLNNKRWSVYAAAASRMGMPSSSSLAMKVISTFRPRYLAMTGLSAGVRGRVRLGDILVADPSWDYGSGKLVLKDGESIFLPAPYQLQLSPFLRNKLRLLASDEVALAEIRSAWGGRKPDQALSMHIGPVASGAAVVADATVLEQVVAQHRKLVGLEMETYAVFAAAEESSQPRPLVFSIKSVSDFADTDKSDDYQDYAAFTSTHALYYFVRKYLDRAGEIDQAVQ